MPSWSGFRSNNPQLGAAGAGREQAQGRPGQAFCRVVQRFPRQCPGQKPACRCVTASLAAAFTSAVSCHQHRAVLRQQGRKVPSKGIFSRGSLNLHSVSSDEFDDPQRLHAAHIWLHCDSFRENNGLDIADMHIWNRCLCASGFRLLRTCAANAASRCKSSHACLQ